MLIDWFTVCAQALNFIILVWLMKRFLYQPILNAIDAREKRIASELADAAAKQADAQKERVEYRRKNDAFDQERKDRLAQMMTEAKSERERLMEDAQKAADALAAKRRELLDAEIENLHQTMTRRAQQEVFAITRKTLTDLAGTSLEERMGQEFIRRLRGMDGPAKKRFAASLESTAQPALVRSAFDLPAEQRASIQTALNEIFLSPIQLRFETDPELISGIEITGNGQKVAWSIADYLMSLEKAVRELPTNYVKAHEPTA